MEQILLFIVTVSGFSGFLLGVYSLLMPVLQRRGISLPFPSRGRVPADGYDYEVDDIDDPDTKEFAATSFTARRTSLLERLPGKATVPARRSEGNEDDGQMLGDLDLSKERAEVEAEEDDDLEAEDEIEELSEEAEVDPVLEELADDDDGPEDDGESTEDDEGEYEDEDEEDGEEAGREPERPAVHVVPGGGSDDMLALFDEAADAFKEVEAWREDLPNPSIQELLTEAREIRTLFKRRA